MVGLFLHSRADSTTGEISSKLRELRAQEAKIQKDLEMAEGQLKQVSEVSDLSMLGEALWRHPITVKLTNWELKKDELLTEISQLEFTLIALEERLKGPLTLIDRRQVEVDPIMLALANQLAALGSDLARKRQYLGEEHRVIRQTREIIRQTKQERVQRRLEIGDMERRANYKTAQDTLAIFKSQLDMLENNREETEKEQKRLNAAQARYEQLLDIRDQTRNQLDGMKQLIASYETMLNDPKTPKVRLVGPAPEPLRVSSPKWQLYMPGGTVLGFMLGVGLVFLIELLNDLVRTPSDVSRHLHIPLLAVICHAEEDDEIDQVDLCHVVRQAPYSIVSECYRRLRANLKLSSSPEALKTLLVTSPSAGDGKTSTAVNLAATFVAEDKSVLLIDTNFRRPRSIALFPKPQSPEKDQAQDGSDFGLSNLLTAQCSYEDVIRPSGVDGLDIIDCGPLPSNPAELLGNSKMKLLTQQQREKYDHIIIDGPPVLLVSEAKVLSSQVDSVILVLNAGTTRRGVAQRTIRELRETGANIVGCVLFGARAMKGGYFHEMFKSYREYQKPQLAGAIQ
jgi:capsular exopolysaccharide synthesis family protein